jgi:CRISPR-associated protein Cas6
MVATGASDEAAFMRDVDAELHALGIQCHCICGRARPLRHGGAPIAAFSLMLHGLGAEQSLRVQTAGIGRHRQLGCGVFVPHKSAAPVGT